MLHRLLAILLGSDLRTVIDFADEYACYDFLAMLYV